MTHFSKMTSIDPVIFAQSKPIFPKIPDPKNRAPKVTKIWSLWPKMTFRKFSENSENFLILDLKNDHF